ncbi:MAG: XamI family restriction endonuclease [Cyanobacteria bacterium SBC]|nr:XamI family restriction endonuclease [Cyanobacteria bacterium SBC]
MNHQENRKISEHREVEIYFDRAQQLYVDAADRCDEIYDIAEDLTRGFQSITESCILEDSRIIKILRYCTIPCLSQMKLGQLVGLRTTANYENKKIKSGSQYSQLTQIAPGIANIISNNLDRSRFVWHNTELDRKQLQLARHYAKQWTCSLIGNQNSTTAFRNWRKDLQENQIALAISQAGYIEVASRTTIRKITDLLPGQYSRERKVQGHNIQKADFAIRLKKSKKLMLLEAKAIGVRIDAFKRIKECRDKAQEWQNSFGKNLIFGAILAGFVPISEVESLISSGHLVFWEHRLEELSQLLSE